MSASLPPTPALETENDDRDALQYQRELARFQRVYKRRKAFLQHENQQKTKATDRLFLLSNDNEPWKVFGLSTPLAYRRRVYEWSGLHFSPLHEACAVDDKAAVEELLALECDTLALDSSGRTPLHQAVIREHFGVIQLLLQHSTARLQLHARDNRDAPSVQYVLEKILRHVKTSQRFSTLSRLADQMLLAMDVRLVNELLWLDIKARGDVRDAVRTGDVERLRFLHELYDWEVVADLDELGYSLLHEACSDPQHGLQVVLYLISELRLDRAKKTTSGSTPLHCAATCGWLEACVLLLDDNVPDAVIDVDMDGLLLSTDERGRTPLHACLYGVGRGRHSSRSDALMTARYLVQQCPEALNVIDYDGFTPLHYAICSGDLALVELMIARGANLFCEVERALPRPEFGEKAVWAPCGAHFQQTNKQRRANQTSTHGESNEQSSSRIHSPVASKACARMREVKAGHVEFPGHAVPMETLWFLLSRPRDKHDTLRPATAPRENSDLSTATEKHSDDLDPTRLGCRRFGGVCVNCQLAPDKTPEFQEQQVAMSPLVLAIRYCRLGIVGVEERLRIVETLLLAGSPVDDLAVHEALRAVQTPRLLERVRMHSGLALTQNHVLDFFCHPFDWVVEENDPRQSMLLSLLNSDAELFDHCVLSSLFRWGYFELLECFIQRSNSVDLDRLVTETPEPASHKRRHAPAITSKHLVCVHRWAETYPNRLAAFAGLAYNCVDELLTTGKIRTSRDREYTDQAIVSAIRIFQPGDRNWATTRNPEQLVEWTRQAIDKGLVRTASALRASIKSTLNVVKELFCALTWPIRMPSLHLAFVDEFAQEMLNAIATMTDATVEVLTKCLAVACMYKTPLPMIETLLTRIKSHAEDPMVTKCLVSKRFGGRTLSQWILQHDRADVAELLFSQVPLNPGIREHLWRGVASAALLNSATPSERWEAPLFQPGDSSTEATERCCWLATRLARVSRSSALVPIVARWLWNHQDQWDLQSLVQGIARWNAIGLMHQLVLLSSNENGSFPTLSQIVTTPDTADGCTPVDLAELLGHHELARTMRQLVGDGMKSANGENWTFSQRRRFGLLHTQLSLPANASTAQDLIHHREVPHREWDWPTAVALNDVHLLAALDSHEFHMATEDSCENDSDALLSLLEVAITNASLDALRYLLCKKTTTVSIPKAQTNELLLKAARHTSPIYAQITLALLQHPAFDPGRLSGDGTDVTLLHRAACFADGTLAASILSLLLAVEGSDVNVRDGFGVTPVAYALASGAFANACFLLAQSRANVRLEAEFEGQTALYYTLHLLPSFTWRWILQTLLRTKRQSAFLHCTTDDCACKGFGAVADDPQCGFCGHTSDVHTFVPFPPWFRDQYETYLDPKQASQNAKDHSEDDDDDASDTLSQHSPVVDEATIEHTYGRLDTQDLERITALRYHELLTTYALVPKPLELLSTAPRDPEKLPTLPAADNCSSEPEADSDANLAAPTAGTAAVDSQTNIPLTTELLSVVTSRLPPPVPISLVLLPSFLRSDVAMVLNGKKYSCGWTTTPSGRIRAVVCVWLRLTAARTQSDRAPSTVFAHWRDVTMGATSTLVSFHGHARARVALDAAAAPVPRPSTAAREEPTSFSSFSSSTSSSSLAMGTSMDPALVIGSHLPSKLLSILHLFLHHWRYAHVYQCFRKWRRHCQSASAQIALHEIEVLGDAWAAESRRVRFHELVFRQRQLEQMARTVLVDQQ